MENINDIKDLFQEQWFLRRRVLDGVFNDNETDEAKNKINNIWNTLDSVDKHLLHEAFEQIIEENQKRIENIREGDLEEIDKVLQIGDLCLQNDVLGRGQY